MPSTSQNPSSGTQPFVRPHPRTIIAISDDEDDAPPFLRAACSPSRKSHAARLDPSGRGRISSRGAQKVLHFTVTGPANHLDEEEARQVNVGPSVNVAARPTCADGTATSPPPSSLSDNTTTPLSDFSLLHTASDPIGRLLQGPRGGDWCPPPPKPPDLPGSRLPSHLFAGHAVASNPEWLSSKEGTPAPHQGNGEPPRSQVSVASSPRKSQTRLTLRPVPPSPASPLTPSAAEAWNQPRYAMWDDLEDEPNPFHVPKKYHLVRHGGQDDESLAWPTLSTWPEDHEPPTRRLYNLPGPAVPLLPGVDALRTLHDKPADPPASPSLSPFGMADLFRRAMEGGETSDILGGQPKASVTSRESRKQSPVTEMRETKRARIDGLRKRRALLDAQEEIRQQAERQARWQARGTARQSS